MTVQAPPRPPEQNDLQALIEEARQRARRRRRRTALAAVLLVLVIAGTCLLVARAGGDGASTSTRLPRSGSLPLAVGVGPFWYMRTLGTMRAPRCVKPLPGVMNPCAANVWFDVVISTETWVGTDGTMRERTVEVSQRFASAADRVRWLAGGKPVPVPLSVAQGDALDVGSGHFPSPVLGSIAPSVPPQEGPPTGFGPIDVGDGLFGYRQLLALPRDGPGALARIEQALTALRHRYGRMLLRWHSPGATVVARDDLGPPQRSGRAIEELMLIAHLDMAPVPARVRLSLLRAATALRGVTATRRGTAGVTLSASSPGWQPASFTFDRRTGELMTGAPADGGPPDVAGADATVVAQGPVASIASLPAGVRPIPGVGNPPLWPVPPPPTAESVAPSVGRASTVFTLLLAAPPGQHAHPAPTAWLGISGSAGHGIYHGPSRASDPCLPTTSVRAWPAGTIYRSGGLVFVYRFSPRTFHLRAWCPGRYQVGIQTFPNPLPAHFTTPPYTGPSGTSAYFRVAGR